MTHHPFFKQADHKRIAIVDVKEPPKLEQYQSLRPEDVPEQRTSTLTPSSLRFLRDVGGLDLVNRDRCKDYYRMQVWEKDGSGFLGFARADNASMGCTIENSHLVAALYEKLRRDVRPGSSEQSRVYF